MGSRIVAFLLSDTRVLGVYWVWVVLAAVVTLCIALFSAAASLLWREWTVAHYNLDGPHRSHWLYGELKRLVEAPTGSLQASWVAEYGPVVAYSSLFRRPHILVTDAHAIRYMYTHSDLFDPEQCGTKRLRDLTEHSLVAPEEAVHHRWRNGAVPSFGPAHIEELMTIVYLKTCELKDNLLERLDDRNGEGDGAGERVGVQIDVWKYLNQATRDIVGLGGVSHDWETLAKERNELLESWDEMRAGFLTRPWLFICQFLPRADWLGDFTKRQTRAKAARDTMFANSQKVVQEKKRLIQAEAQGEVEKADVQGTDLLTALVRANMAPDVKSEERLTDQELDSQIPLSLIEGSQTIALALTWALIMLAKHHGIQDALRVDCQSLADEQPSLDELDTLPYLEAFTREILRVYPPIPCSMHQPRRDIILPLSTSVRGKNGVMMDAINVKTGTGLMLAMYNVNTSTSVFGPDAAEFRPERWLHPETMPEHVKSVRGAWANLLTFGSGSRSRIGYRFELAEIKAILFTLIRHLAFEEIEADHEIVRVGAIGASRPMMPGRQDAIPIMIRRLI